MSFWFPEVTLANRISPFQLAWHLWGGTWKIHSLTHLLSGWPKKPPNLIFTTEMGFPKSLKLMNSGSELLKGAPVSCHVSRREGTCIETIPFGFPFEGLGLTQAIRQGAVGNGIHFRDTTNKSPQSLSPPENNDSLVSHKWG